MSTRSGRNRAALRRRAGRDASRASLIATRPSIGAAETPAPVLEVMDRLVEVLSAKVRPECVGDPEFGVCGLPEEEVRDAKLAAGPNQQVRVGEPVGVES